MKSFAMLALLPLAVAAPVLAAGGADARWKSVPLDDGTTAAYVEGGGALRRVVLRCSHGKAELYANTGEMKGERPVTLALTGAQAGSRTLALHRDKATGQWSTTLEDRGVIDLLSGHDSSIRTEIDGHDTGSVTLAGSTAVIKPALRSCSGSLRAAATPTPVPETMAATEGKTSKGKSKKTEDVTEAANAEAALGEQGGPLPIKTGYYVARAEACERPRSVLFYDGKKLIKADGPDSFTGTSASRFTKKRGDYAYGKLGLTLHVESPEKIKVVEPGTTMRLCKTSEIPSSFKQ